MTAPGQPVATVPVTAAPALDPGARRTDVTLPAGMTVEAIVRHVLPGADGALAGRVRVHLATGDGAALVPRRHWHAVRPRAGVHVVVRVVAGKNALRSILQVFVSIAASFLAPGLGAFLFPGLAPGIATGITALALTTVGGLLINALIPPAAPAQREQEDPRFSISGWRNPMQPNGAVPAVLGRHRYAPPFAGGSYTEIVGDQQYIRALFCAGYGPLDVSDLRIGDTPIDRFDEVEIETRTGNPGDAKVTLYAEQVIEEQFGVDLRYERPRDDAGAVIAGAAPVEAPVTRLTASDAARAALVIAFPAGLVTFDDKGRKQTTEIQLRIRHRPVGAGGWAHSETVTIRHATTEGFFRQHGIIFATRGRHEVEITRLTVNSDDTQVSDRTVLASLQSIRPEYPVAIDRPMALIAVRVRATYQLNGPLDTFNAVFARIAPDWDAASNTWLDRPTRNPASLFRFILEQLSAKPVTAADIDLDALADWHVYCAQKGLQYDAVLDDEASLLERLQACAAAGRASPRWDGTRWSVVIDRPQSLVVDHVSQRNARAVRWERSYFEPPDAFRVPFFDETNDWQAAERIVPWPGFFGDIAVTEELVLAGKTNPDEIWREARRRQYEIIHRPDRFSAAQDGAVRVATRGDLVMASFDTLERTMAAARVTRVSGRMIIIDEAVTFVDGTAYALRFRVADAADAIGESVVVSVSVEPGEQQVLIAVPGAQVPQPGDVVHIGPSASDSVPVLVAATEAGEDFSTVLHMVPAAPQIDDMTDAEVPPDWDGRVGELAPVVATPPAPPVFTRVATGLSGTGSQGVVVATVAPGAGSMAPVARYEIEHRPPGGEWIVVPTPASSASLRLSGQQTGAQIELRARAFSVAGFASAYGAAVTVTVDGSDAPLPAPIVHGSVTIAAGLGHAAITLTTGTGTARLAIYRQAGAGGVLDRTANLVREIVTGSSVTVNVTDGDATRSNLLANGGFDDALGWTADGGWSIAGGVASHAPGAASTLAQAVVPDEGASHVVSLTVSGRTTGDVTPQLTGGTGVSGAAVSVNGLAAAELVADADADTFSLAASADFDGAVDTVALYSKTSGCLPPGLHTWWFEPINADGAAGPLSGPHVQTVR